MAARQGLALGALGDATPLLERPETAPDHAMRAPEREQRHRQAPPGVAIGPVVLETVVGKVVGYENHSGSTTLGQGQEPFGTVLHGYGNNGTDRTEGARTRNVFGSYLHGPILPANPGLADLLIGLAAARATGRPFEPEPLTDAVADEARGRQVRRLLGVAS